MKKILLVLGVFLATSALSGMTAQAETFLAKKNIQVPGANQEQLLNKVRTWAGRNAVSYNADTKTGIVLASGEITYPSPSIDRIQYTILFEMKNIIQGNKVTVIFEKVMLKSPTHYSQENNERIDGEASPVKSKKDIAAETKSLTYIASNLEAYLLAKSTKAFPLVKCPDCGILCPSSEEMKGHMKSHEHMKDPEHLQDNHGQEISPVK